MLVSQRNTVNSRLLRWGRVTEDAEQMQPIGGITSGEVLRVWRKYTGLTVQQLADELRRQEGAPSEDTAVRGSKGGVSDWETGRRSPSPEKVRQIAIALGLNPDEQDAMIGMWRAAGSASALPPRMHWEHNYHPERDRADDVSAQNGPGWVWFRCGPAEGEVTASVGWAPWGDDFTVPATSAGMLVSAPASLPNPPLQVTFSIPAWADFGNGLVPSAVAESLQINAIDGMTLSRGRFVDPPELTDYELTEKVKPDVAWLEKVTKNFKVIWQQFKPQLGAMRPNERVCPLDGARTIQVGWAGVLRVDNRGEYVDQLLLTPEQIKRIRKVGRDLSAEATAHAVNEPNLASAGDRITDNQIENLERRGTIPNSKWIIARLDHVYQLDGQLGIERVNSITAKTKMDKRGNYVIRFPDFWIGPVWLQLRAPDGSNLEDTEATLDLHWGFWRRFQQVRNGTVVTTRKAAPDDERLLAKLPPGWSLAAGTGVAPGAIDINHDWYPATWRAAGRLVEQGVNALWKSGRLKNLSQAEQTALQKYIASPRSSLAL
jgi:transcriptional regulator with XRE-family HTH domain